MVSCRSYGRQDDGIVALNGNLTGVMERRGSLEVVILPELQYYIVAMLRNQQSIILTGIIMSAEA